MKIGLIAVDTVNFPNLPLMKLSAWHKAQGDKVELFHKHSLKEADRVYMSKVFTFTPEYKYKITAGEIIKSGTGYFYPTGGEKLPAEVEHIMPDYSLYGITDTAYGFLTRGCPRNCGFCIVSKKEGCKSVKVADLKEFWNGQKNIVLLDPNLLAYKNHAELLQSLIDSGASVDFTQGLDVKLLTEKNISLIKKIKIKMLHFSWDNYEDKDVILPKLELFKTHYPNCPCSVYVLCNYNSTIAEDLERIYTLNDLGYLPFVMVYKAETLSSNHTLIKMKRWANSHTLFKACPDFERYENDSVQQKKENRKKYEKLL
jgi:hypothetical protein